VQASPRSGVDRDRLLAKAAGRAAAMLGMNNKHLAQVIGFSESTVSRIVAGQRGIDAASKEGELALLLVRILRSLDALVGNDASRRRLWMSSYNTALKGVPFELIRGAEGLVHTLAYLDGMRAPL
jgi:hypothetical protein